METMASKEQERYQILEEDFVASFLEELIPGILHNFANPLNGIMGRSKLLQRRLEETVRKMRVNHPEAAMELAEDHKKLLKDVNSISLESDRFFDMFRHVASKFSTTGDRAVSSINLSQLVDSEMKFADFYLDFKHEVSKDLKLEEILPEVYGAVSDYSIALWTIIRYAMKGMRNCAVKDFAVMTSHDDTHVYISVRHSGSEMTKGQAERFFQCLLEESGELHPDLAQQKHLLNALLLLKKYGASTRFDLDTDKTTLSIAIPYYRQGVVSREP
jgi:signal transduction histidine kinase